MRKILFIICLMLGCSGVIASVAIKRGVDTDLTTMSMQNEGSYIPPQCYTNTKGENGEVYNPCYSCHTDSMAPNYTSDSALQESYEFAEYLNVNHWKNLFIDKTARVESMSDDDILKYVRTDNYLSEKGKIILAETLKDVPSGWDYDGNGRWDGYVPDCYFSFDNEGFDRSPDGAYTGWRAFAYAPFLGTFWPTNGSTDDVLIRLADVFRRGLDGSFDLMTYKINMAVVEAMITRRDVGIEPVDEKLYGTDLNKNGRLDTADMVVYRWAPLKGEQMHYAGAARRAQDRGELKIAAGLYPIGTEFLHSVRYIDLQGDSIAMAPRMKELRYAVKKKYKNYTVLEHLANEEMKETYDFPDRMAEYFGNMEQGISNSQGWAYQGFIEDAYGELRPQNYEETVFCMGCHTNVGATSDSTYAFPRKFDHDSFQKGWYHWSQKGLEGTPEPKADYKGYGEKYEYSFYLENNRAGDEFRGNDEVIAKFFDDKGELKQDMIEELHRDVSVLLYPSQERGLRLNKAYKVIVEDQSFPFGRDANVAPVKNVHAEISEKNIMTGVKKPINRSN